MKTIENCPQCKSPDYHWRLIASQRKSFRDFYAVEFKCTSCGFGTTIEIQKCLEKVLELLEIEEECTI